MASKNFDPYVTIELNDSEVTAILVALATADKSNIEPFGDRLTAVEAKLQAFHNKYVNDLLAKEE